MFSAAAVRWQRRRIGSSLWWVYRLYRAIVTVHRSA